MGELTKRPHHEPEEAVKGNASPEDAGETHAIKARIVSVEGRPGKFTFEVPDASMALVYDALMNNRRIDMHGAGYDGTGGRFTSASGNQCQAVFHHIVEKDPEAGDTVFLEIQ